MDLAGRRAIVLGGTSGIGLAVTRQLEEAGATVIAGSRSHSNIELAKSVTGMALVSAPSTCSTAPR